MTGKTKAAPKKGKNAAQKQFSAKDFMIGLILMVFLGFIVYSRLSGLSIDQWSGELTGIVGDFTIYLLGIIGIFEFCYDNDFTLFVPDKFIQHKEESMRRQTKEYLQEFFDEEAEFLDKHEESRLADTLSMMGLSAQGYQHVRSKVLEARLAPINDIETARQKMLDLVFYSDVVCDMHQNSAHLNMGSLRYYFKFHDLMHDVHQSDAIAKAMATFIYLTCEQAGISLPEIDVIMVPHNSNYMLGLTVSKLLNKRFIKMIPPEKRIGSFSYEGVIPDKITKKTVDVLILHDVLLTGRQIWESANALKETHPNCKIHGLFSVIYRNVNDGKNVLEHSHNIKCYSLVELTEADIQQELSKRGKL